MSGDDAQTIADWNGRVGEGWRVHQERLDDMLAAYGEAVLRAAGSRPCAPPSPRTPGRPA